MKQKPTTTEEWLEAIYHVETDIRDMLKAKKITLADLDLIDTDGVCKLLNVSARTVANYRKSGELRFSKRGGRYYYLISDIRDMIMKDFDRR